LFAGIEADLVREIDIVAYNTWPFLVQQHNVAVRARVSGGGPPVRLARGKAHPDTVFAIDKDIVGAAHGDAIHLRQKILDTPIGMQLLNAATADISDKDAAIVQQGQPVWLAARPSDELLATVRVNARDAAAPVRYQQRTIGPGNDRFGANKVVTGKSEIVQCKTELFDGNRSTAHDLSFQQRKAQHSFL